jgi:hypothetical protein
MKKLTFILPAALLASAFPLPTLTSLTAADSPPAEKAKLDTVFRRAGIALVAKEWERLFGGTVTVSDRARVLRVSLQLFAVSKAERRKMFVASLRENGIYVVERGDAVLFDTEPEVKPAK